MEERFVWLLSIICCCVNGFRQHLNGRSPVNWLVSPFAGDNKALIVNLAEACPKLCHGPGVKSYLFT